MVPGAYEDDGMARHLGARPRRCKGTSSPRPQRARRRGGGCPANLRTGTGSGDTRVSTSRCADPQRERLWHAGRPRRIGASRYPLPVGSGNRVDAEPERAVGLIDRAGPRGLVALTGAGISTDAGIPDFRGPRGVWTRNPEAERLSDLRSYLSDEALRRRAWQERLTSPVWYAEPTAGHRALVELERSGILACVITQNTDGLHLLAGHDPERVVEMHGSVHETVCWTCGHRQPTRAVLRRVAAGDSDPRCRRPRDGGDENAACNGILKTATISFGQALDPATLAAARRAVCEAAVLLVVGTTLTVQPAAGLVPLAGSNGARIVIVNGAPTAMDHVADVVLRGPISDLLPALVASRG